MTRRPRETERERMARWQRVMAGMEALLVQEFPDDIARRRLLAEWAGMHLVSCTMINRLLDRPPEEAADELLRFLGAFTAMFHEGLHTARTGGLG